MMMWMCPWLKEIRGFEIGDEEDNCKITFLLWHLTVLVIIVGIKCDQIKSQ